ncbi:carbohydrate ABC transporter membrane protein 1, CUT1 family (TC 3.A.1.1.-) [Pelagibacterium luteolum]|uniref:Carbohydrate ABC transporter membrane protein 1, CUT1 family (TC 3.A.1.1.-) n=1 Tax=Pelagibacterium luteolum TaxID=440168 RepID=A0A1G7WCI1_9HYPH|nr:sugar ABC transporter permease [Pelagibacterium luteolum]SDG69672.1 carbohydrate ABC transporter membrane protein 1, CUT1 family (TC 3.A.1.1.-) [Pelagibacterium luteolum]
MTDASASERQESGTARYVRQLFTRNISAKIAATPMIVTVLVIFIGCTLWTIYYSFTNSRLLPTGTFVGLDQYTRLFGTSRWNVSVWNLIWYGVFSLSFTLVIGFLLAVLMDQKIRFESAFRTIMLYPFALSFIVTGLVWQWIMNPTLGLQGTMRNLGFDWFTFDWIARSDMVIYALLIAGLWQGTGFMMVLMLAGLRGVDEEIWKASRVDGIPTWRTYLFIVLPMMRGVLVTAVVLAGSGIVRLYDLVVALTRGGPGISSEVPAKYVYDYMFTAGNIGQGLAASTMMLLTVMIIIIPWAYLEFGGRGKKS